ncbi:helicase associated domain-containing protein [Streptomyces sp. NPDC101227]|uniref:helicase associated domain-containing protein n=1 Tax=Streptomyces sp. NPDC101227 TaxID=3366136 RepID=UPI00382D49F7
MAIEYAQARRPRPTLRMARGAARDRRTLEPAWPNTWQRRYAALRELVRYEENQAGQTDIVLLGVTVHGMDIGRWLATQRQPAIWTGLDAAQCQLLAELGV